MSDLRCAMFGPPTDWEPEDEDDANEFCFVVQRGARRVSIEWDKRVPDVLAVLRTEEGRGVIRKANPTAQEIIENLAWVCAPQPARAEEET